MKNKSTNLLGGPSKPSNISKLSTHQLTNLFNKIISAPFDSELSSRQVFFSLLDKNNCPIENKKKENCTTNAYFFGSSGGLLSNWSKNLSWDKKGKSNVNLYENFAWFFLFPKIDVA